MLDSTEGPPRKPVLAATNSRPASNSQHHGQRREQMAVRKAHLGKDAAEHDRVERLAFDRRGVPQQVQQDDAACREREAEGHHQHGQLAGADDRLGQAIDVVGNRFDPGIGAAAQRVRLQEQRQHEEPAGFLARTRGLRSGCRACSAGRPSAWAKMPQPISTAWVATKPRKIGSRKRMLSLAPRRLSHSNTSTMLQAVHSLNGCQPAGSSENKRVGAAGHRDRDGQHVIDDQRGSGHQPGARAEQRGRRPGSRRRRSGTVRSPGCRREPRRKR